MNIEITDKGRALLATPSGWQDIATAPRDGSMFLCWSSAVRFVEQDDGVADGYDASECDFCVWKDSEHGGYFDALSSPRADIEQVTHWMPLPEPPK